MSRPSTTDPNMRLRPSGLHHACSASRLPALRICAWHYGRSPGEPVEGQCALGAGGVRRAGRRVGSALSRACAARVVLPRRVGLPREPHRVEPRRPPPAAHRPLDDAADSGLARALVDGRVALVPPVRVPERARARRGRRAHPGGDAPRRCRSLDRDDRRRSRAVLRRRRGEHHVRVPDHVHRRARVRVGPAAAGRPRRSDRPSRLVRVVLRPARAAVLGRRGRDGRGRRHCDALAARLADRAVPRRAARRDLPAVVGPLRPFRDGPEQQPRRHTRLRAPQLHDGVRLTGTHHGRRRPDRRRARGRSGARMACGRRGSAPDPVLGAALASWPAPLCSSSSPVWAVPPR